MIKPPEHIAIIMMVTADGKKKGKKGLLGIYRGAETNSEIVEEVGRKKINFLPFLHFQLKT